MSIDCATYGTIARDSEVKTSKNNKQYVRFSIRSGDGDNAQFVSVMYFGADAADLAPKLLKGVAVYCEGSLRLDEWTQQDGTKRSGLSVMSFYCASPRLAATSRRDGSCEGMLFSYEIYNIIARNYTILYYFNGDT
jgi:single-stranded DNA-binding protein